jgi:hypothetical protein
MLRHEIPTHLHVQDKVLFGLTARQTVHLLVGLAASAALWTHLSAATGVPLSARAGAAALCLGAALLVALVRPYGRGVEEWAVVALRYATTPRCAVWQPLALIEPPRDHASARSRGDAGDTGGWIDYALVMPHHGTCEAAALEVRP